MTIVYWGFITTEIIIVLLQLEDQIGHHHQENQMSCIHIT